LTLAGGSITHLEELGLLDALEQVVAAALLLDDIAGLVRLPCVSTLNTTANESV
jgi:hypothetical protein